MFKVASVLALSFWVMPALAYAAEPAETFPEIVVSASVEPSEAKTLPATVQVITHQELADAGIQSVQQALSYYVPGNGNEQPGAFASVGLRGFASGTSVSSVLGDRVVILVDGLRTSSGNPAVIPFGIVDHIEILRGPSSVLYGGSAMGGVVNVITKRGKGKMHGEVGLSYGSFDHAKASFQASGAMSDSWGIALGISGQKSRDYTTGDGTRYDNTHSANTDIGATGTWTISDNSSLHLVGAHRAVFDAGSPGSTAWLTPNDKVNLNYSHLSADFNTTLDNDIHLRAAIFGNESHYRFYDGMMMGDSKYSTQTMGTRVSGSVPLAQFGRLAVGADYSFIREKAYGQYIYQPDTRSNVAGLFAEHRFEYGRFSMINGVRYDNYQSKMKGNSGILASDVNKHYDHVSWNSGATFWLTNWLGVKGSIGTAFVAPTAVNLGGDFSDGYTHYVGNPNLKAESSLTGEVGFEAEYNNFHGELTYFQTRFKNRISTAYLPTWDKTWVNIPAQRLAGFDLSLSWHGIVADTVKLSPYFNAEYFVKRRNNDGTLATYVPRYSATAGLGIGYGIVWLDVNARLTGSQMQNNASYPYDLIEVDPYTVFNARVTFKATKQLDLYLGIDNIGDKQYALTNGYPMPGRAYYCGIKYKF